MITLTPSDGCFPAVITASGPVSLCEVKKTLQLVTRINREYGLVWDLRKAELEAFHCSDCKDFAETIAMVLPRENSYRVAMIGAGMLHFGLFRAFQAYADCAGVKREYAYFVDPLEANEWAKAYVWTKPVGLSRQLDNLTTLSA